MSTHDAEHFRQRHRDQRIPEREPLSAPKFPRQAFEPRSLEQPPWPRNLFGELASIAELMAQPEDTVPSAAGTRISAAATAG
jgi:hypothetical protein